MANSTSSSSRTPTNDSSEHRENTNQKTSDIIDEDKGSNLQGPLPEPTVTAQDWAGPDDPECPQNWSVWKRIYLTSVPSAYCLTVTFASSIYTAGDVDVQQRFGVGPTTALLGLSPFVWG